MCPFFFFFQAEDGIRDKLVTGVQTCALPISDSRTRITAKSRASHANPAGSVQRCLCRSRHSPRLILISRRSDGNHVPKAPKGNEETGKAAHEGRTACAEKTR